MQQAPSGDDEIRLADRAGPEEADIVYDHRGGRSPWAYQHWALIAGTHTLRCQRQAVRDLRQGRGPQKLEFEIDAQQARSLREQALKLTANMPKPKAQKAIILDLGTSTTTLRMNDKLFQLLTDGRQAPDPYPEDFMRLLANTQQLCTQAFQGQQTSIHPATSHPVASPPAGQKK